MSGEAKNLVIQHVHHLPRPIRKDEFDDDWELPGIAAGVVDEAFQGRGEDQAIGVRRFTHSLCIPTRLKMSELKLLSLGRGAHFRYRPGNCFGDPILGQMLAESEAEDLRTYSSDCDGPFLIRLPVGNP